MADNQALVQRVYEIKVQGADTSLKHVQSLTVAFNKMDAAKRKLNTQLDKKIAAGDTQAISALTARIKELETGMKNLDKQRQASAKENALQAKAERELAAAEAIRTKSLIDQEKELDRQIALEEKKSRQTQKTKRELEALPGTYYALLAAQRATLELYRKTPETSPMFEQVKKGAIDAKAKVDDFNRSLSPDGTLVGEYRTGIINAFSKLGLNDVLKKQKDDLNNQLGQIVNKNKELANQLRVVGDSGAEAYRKIETELVKNIQQQEHVEGQIKDIRTAFQQTGGIGQQVVNGIGASFKNLKRDIGQMIIGYIGFQAAIQGTRRAIALNKELSDQYVDLQRVLEATDDEFENIKNSLRGIDTRTSLKQLVDFAFIAAKAGVAKDQIAGVTASLDQLYLVAGKSLGDPTTTFESLVKLNTIFNDRAPVTGENLQKLGNAIIQLDNSGVASAGFMVDFAKRLAGIEGITKVQIQSVLGLAAAFEENGASAEVAATATSQVMVKLFSDTEKYSAIAGMTKQSFEDLLNSNPGEALLLVAKGLKGNTKTATEFAESFSQLEANGVRIQTVMGTLAAKTDQFREKISVANNALQDNGAIIAGAQKKNENFGAVIDKVSKQIELIGSNKTFVALMNAIAAVVLVLLQNLPALITILALYASGWALVNKQMIISRAELIFQRTLLPILTALFGGQANALKAYTFASQLAGKAMTFLGKALQNPIFRIFSVAIAATVVAVKAFGNTVNAALPFMDKFAMKQQFITEAQQQASKALTEIKAKEEVMLSIIRDRTLADEVRQRALNNLVTTMGKYGEGLNLENILTDKGTAALKAYNLELSNKAQLQASAAIAQRENQKLERLYQQQFDVADAIKSGGEIDTKNFDQDFLDAFYKYTGRSASQIGQFIGDKVGVSFTYSGKDLNEFATVLNREIDKQLKRATGAEVAKADLENLFGEKPGEAVAPSVKAAITQYEIDIESLRNQISGLDDQINKFKGNEKDLNVLIANRKKLQDELDRLLNKKSGSPRGSRLSGENKDAVRDIDAQRDQELADEKRYRLLNLTDEENHLLQIRDINVGAIDEKLKILKGANAAERKMIAELMLERINITQETEDKVYDIRKTSAERQLADALRMADDERRAVIDDPTSLPLEKLTAERHYQEDALTAQINFNNRMDELEAARGDRSVDEERKRAQAIRAIALALSKIRMEIEKTTLEENLRAIEESATKQINEVKQRVAAQTISILEDDSLGNNTKANKIKDVEREGTKSILANEVAENRIALAQKEEQLKQGLITEAAYSDAKTKLKLAELALAKHVADTEQGYLAKTISSFKDAFRNITGIFKGIKVTKAEVDAALEAGAAHVKEAVSVAFNGYFEGKRNQIDADKENAIQRLNIEEQQVLNLAESESEKESIRNQYEYKRKQEEKKAAEQRKKLALTQMTIEFGLAVAKTLASYPFPWSLIPVAGLTALYLANRSQAESAKFEKGGMIRKYAFGGMPKGGGEIKGPSHARGGVPFNAEAEGNELYIINKRAAALNKRITVTGTPRQVASAVNSFGGGNNFSPGAKLRKLEYGGMLGSNLKAPVNPQSYLTASSGISDVDNVYKAISMQTENLNRLAAQTNQRIDQLQVIVVAKEVDDTNTKRKKANSIATI